MSNPAQEAVIPGAPTVFDPHWKPLLVGADRDRATACITAITRVLANGLPDTKTKQSPGFRASVASGYAGVALLFSYLAQTRRAEKDAYHAVGFLEQAIESLASHPMPPNLFAGFSGVGWTMRHLQKHLLDPSDIDATEDLDQALLGYVRQSPWHGEFDLIGGVVGFGVYALEDIVRPAAMQCLSRVIECLEESAVHLPDGIAWWTNPLWYHAETRAKHPEGYYNLGMAHGLPGVIAFLSRVVDVGMGSGAVRPLLEESVRFLLAQETTIGDWEGFPSWVGFDIRPKINRQAWCYGDPGVAAAIHMAGRVLDRHEWQDKARAIARRAAQCPPQRAGVVDANLCHGAAGLGHVFNRLYQATGDEMLGEAARFWFKQTFALQKATGGIAGFSAWWADDLVGQKWIDDPGLLLGAAGIALALQAAISPVDPAWDRLLLVDIPSRGSSP